MDAPVIDLQYQNLNCVNTSTLAMFSSSINFDSVKWTGPGLANEDDETLVISRPGNYQLSVYAVNGCFTALPFTVEENIADPEVNAGEDQYWNCNTTSIMIDANLSPGPVEIRWEILEEGDILTDPTKEDIEVGEPGIYTISVRNIENGCDARDSVSVIRNEDIPEAVETFITDLSCFEMQDGMIQINEIMGGTAPYTVYLNGENYGENIDFIDNLDAGNYQMKILDAYECELNIDLEVLQPTEMIMDAPQNVDIGFRLDETIRVTHNLSSNEIMSIIWFDKDGNIIGNGEEITLTGLENNVLRVELTHINGCIIEREVRIFINYELPVYSPTIFSPNEDGLNDVFTLYASEYAGSIGSLSIFNRWGEEMYSIRNIDFNDESNGWRGMKNGKPVDPAVYTYQAIILLPEGGERKISGDVTLVR
jgi:gliding motility-associated-like protein